MGDVFKKKCVIPQYKIIQLRRAMSLLSRTTSERVHPSQSICARKRQILKMNRMLLAVYLITISSSLLIEHYTTFSVCACVTVGCKTEGYDSSEQYGNIPENHMTLCVCVCVRECMYVFVYACSYV